MTSTLGKAPDDRLADRLEEIGATELVFRGADESLQQYGERIIQELDELITDVRKSQKQVRDLLQTVSAQ